MVKPDGESAPQNSSPQDRLIAATEDLIGEVGWGKVTTRQVAARAGVNHALIHYYYGSLQALMARTAEQAVTAVFDRMDELLLGSGDLAAGIRAALAWLGSLEPSISAWAAYPDLLAHCQRDPDLRAQYVQATAELREAVSSRVKGVPDRSMAKGVTTAVIAALDGLLAQYLLDPSLDLDAAADALVTLVE